MPILRSNRLLRFASHSAYHAEVSKAAAPDRHVPLGPSVLPIVACVLGPGEVWDVV